jgi:hypothetical protein
MMRLYGAIQKVEPQDDGTVRVHGIATSEAVDEQGEIVRSDAIRAAIPDYMRFPALREMHQLSAAGTTLEAEVCEDGTTRIVAHVVDPVAVAKVRNQVYRGFSIGGRVTQREAGNPKTVTALVLNEISLVDRPANPEAIFDCWKAVMPSDSALIDAEPLIAKAGPTDPKPAPLGQPFNAPIQIWACAVPDHRHLTKAGALKCLKGGIGVPEDQAPTEIGASQNQKIESAETPSAEADDNATSSLTERLRKVSQNVARVIADLDWLRVALEVESADESEASQERAQLQAIITELSDFLSSYTAQEIDKTPVETQVEGLSTPSAMLETSPAGSSDLERGLAFSRKNRRHTQQLDDEITKTRHSRADQGLLDVAHSACGQSPGTDMHTANLTATRSDETALAKVLGEVVPMIEKLSKRVDEIARTPLPPLTLAKGTVSVSKQQDRGSSMGNGELELSPEAIAAALAKMSKEEQTLTLIKASYATPIRIPGSAADQR